jgi:oxygen-independent coproporphyrinogen-3 oxidase
MSIALRAPEPALVARLDVPGPRYTSYPPVPVWQPMSPSTHASLLERASERTGPLSLYVHIPFCAELCSYCGCNVVVTSDRGRVERYLEALGWEIELAAKHLGARRAVSRVHFGGGTPTFLGDEELEGLWERLASRFDIGPDADLAIEVNPTTLRDGQLELLARLGFRRLSFGVQDLEPAVQQAIGRELELETLDQFTRQARALGFASINFDLIYGLPRQTKETLERTVDRALTLRPDRIALFSFAYLPELRPNQRRLGASGVLCGHEKLGLFLAARARLLQAGYEPVGMDHFALPSDELARAARDHRLQRDFQGYTPGAAPETIAFGSSGVTQLADAYVQNIKTLGEYRSALAEGRLPTERGHHMTADDVWRGRVISDLMCNFEVDLGALAIGSFAAERGELAKLEREGLVDLDGDYVTVTGLGRLFIRNVAMVFDAYLNAGPRRASQTV